MYRASKFRRIVVGALLAFSFVASGPKEAEAYTHHEKSCAVHERDANHDAHVHGAEASTHTADCRDLPVGHDHGPDTKADHCHLGHCHGAQSGWVGSVKLVSVAQVPARDRGFAAIGPSAYLNPHLSLPLQPPRNS